MDLTDWLGFIISAGAILFMVWRLGSEASRQRKNPGQYSREQRQKEHELREVFKAMGIEVEDDEEDEIEHMRQRTKQQTRKKTPALPENKAVQKITSPTLPSIKRTEQTIRPRKYSEHAVAHIIQKGPSRGKKLMGQFPSLKEMIILQEIIGSPKSLSPIEPHEYKG